MLERTNNQLTSARISNYLRAHASFSIKRQSAHLFSVSIHIKPPIIEAIKRQTLNLLQNKHIEGFKVGIIPNDYLEHMYFQEINAHLNDFILKNIVLDLLTSEIIARKLLLQNHPRLIGIENTKDNHAYYHFSLAIAETIILKDWKSLAFKFPRRKRYKDIDKQVEKFIQQEAISSADLADWAIHKNSWVYLESKLLDHNKNPINPLITSNFWIKISKDHTNHPFYELLHNKKAGDSFHVSHLNIVNPTEQRDLHNIYYNFLCTIRTVVPCHQLSIEHFKKVFKLKSKNEIHDKMTEVFSYRNDQSQRQAIIEEIFDLLLSKNRFEIPKHFILRRKEYLLTSLAQRPDYYVYRMQKDFDSNVLELAEKQLKEEIIMSQIAYEENLELNDEDIEAYLQLSSVKKTNEFLYFKPLEEQFDAPNNPLTRGYLEPAILREKTLNHVIRYLSH